MIVLLLLADASYWATWFPGVCVALLAVAAIAWRLLRVLFRIEHALPTLLGIADQFEPNGGSSLHDQLTNIHDVLEEHTRQDEERFSHLDAVIRQLPQVSLSAENGATVTVGAPSGGD